MRALNLHPPDPDLYHAASQARQEHHIAFEGLGQLSRIHSTNIYQTNQSTTNHQSLKPHQDGESGRTYYYCAESGETAWELPPGTVLEENAREMSQVSAEEYSSHYGVSVAQAREFLAKWYGSGEGGEGKGGGVCDEADLNELLDEAGAAD